MMLYLEKIIGEMVGVTGIEPVTPSMSTKCSPAELHPHFYIVRMAGTGQCPHKRASIVRRHALRLYLP